MNRIFLTGGTGFVGSRFIDLYCRKFDITALMRSGSDPGKKVRIATGDLLDQESLLSATKGCDAIVHIGGATPNRAYAAGSFDATTVGTRNLVAAARAHRIRCFIFVSSLCVLFPKKGPYARSKIEAEGTLMRSGLEWTLLRPDTILGPGARDLGRTLRFWRSARYIPVIGDGAYTSQPIYVDDVCGAVAAALETPASAGRAISLAGKDQVTFNEFVRRFCRVIGNDRCRLVHLPKPAVYPLARIAAVIHPEWGLNAERVDIITAPHTVDLTLMKSLLRIAPIPFEEAVCRTVSE
ncbi:MAG: NAD(P)H-binding protein (plasmid) [Candidatus Manganitrophus sp.]|nr:MAG: NAD(P)H-binding protein [Candidatus Manganitrophus sp.]